MLLHIFVGVLWLLLCVGVHIYMGEHGYDSGTANIVFFGFFVGGMVLYFALLLVAPNLLTPVVNKLWRIFPPKKQSTQQKNDNPKLKRHSESLRIFDQYTEMMFGGHLSPEDIERLNEYVRDYLIGKKITRVKNPLTPTELKVNDLYHYGWNMWNFFGGIKQERASQWLQVTFEPLRKQDSQSIIKKMRNPGKLPSAIPIENDIQSFITRNITPE